MKPRRSLFAIVLTVTFTAWSEWKDVDALPIVDIVG